MSNKQTSIEFIETELQNLNILVDSSIYVSFVRIFDQAKAMHKKEIKDAVGVGSQFDRDYLYGYHDKAEQYYTETYGKE